MTYWLCKKMSVFKDIPTEAPGFPNGSVLKESTCNAGDAGEAGLIPGLGRSPGGGNNYSLQYSCLGNPMDRGACWATVHGSAKSWTQRGN